MAKSFIKKGKCLNIGNGCKNADAGAVLDIDVTDEFICPSCKTELIEVKPTGIPVWAIILIIVGVLGGGGAAYYYMGESTSTETTESKPSPEKATLSQAEVTLTAGETQQLAVTILPADADQTVAWQSSAPDIATVNNTGVVAAVKEGNATISVKTENSLSASCTVTIKPASSTTTGGGTNTKPTLDGREWDGEFKNGKPHGVGVMKFTKRQIIDTRDPEKNEANAGDYMTGAKYDNGKLIQGQLHRTDGTKKAIIIGKGGS